MSRSTKAGYLGRRRAEDLHVRRWLQLGAASAGMGAALIGWSLIGPGVGAASADSAAGSSSAGPAASSSKADSGSTGSSPRGRASTVAPRADARPTTPRTVAGDGADEPSQEAPRSNRVTAAAAPSVADRLANATNMNSRVAATPNNVLPSAAQNAVTPVVVAASRADPLGALGRFVTSTVKELLNRKTTLNPLQKLDDLSPKQKSLLDLIPSPKSTVPKEDSLWYRQVQANEAARQQRADANQQRIAEIMQRGVKFTARDGTPVYSIDGKVFVRYTVVSIINGKNAPPVPTLFTLSDRGSERNRDSFIRNHLKIDPAQVRSLRGK